MEKTRYFTNVRGFSDGTKYIEVRPYTSILHGSYGTMVCDNWNLAECLRAVDDGNFKEIPDPNIKKPAPKTKRRWRKVKNYKDTRFIFKALGSGNIFKVSIEDCSPEDFDQDLVGIEILS